MAYVTRTKDNAGDVGRAADQQQGVDNEEFLYAKLMGPNPPAATGGIVRCFFKKTGIADVTATTILTITTTNETGSTDGGAYGLNIEGVFIHGGSSAGDNAAQTFNAHFNRAMTAAGAGQNSAGVVTDSTGVAESEGGTTKGLVDGSLALSIVETTEYSQAVKIYHDLDGSAVTTGVCIGMATLYYYGFLTAPVITSAE